MGYRVAGVASISAATFATYSVTSAMHHLIEAQARALVSRPLMCERPGAGSRIFCHPKRFVAFRRKTMSNAGAAGFGARAHLLR